MLNIQGYNIEPELRKDRTDTLNGIGGGILVYAKEELIIKPVEVNNDMNMFSRFEILSKDDGTDNLSVTLVYRPPRARAENTLELCKLFENTSANSIFIGDFNFPSINWQDQTADRSCENFLECTLDNNFEQMIHFPTHVRGNILDLFFTNRPENVLNVESLGNLSTSDHSIIEIDVLFRSKFNVSSEYIYDWKNGDNAELKNYLMEVDWDQELKDKNTEDSWKLIKDKIKSGTDTYIPKILRRRNNNHQWMTRFVKRIVRKKQRDYNSYMHTRTDDNFNRFKETEKKCKRAIRSAKKKFEMNIARNGNKRPFNSYIKSKTRSRVNIGPLKDNGILISDNLQMATILNKTFSDVFTHEEHTNIPHCERVNFPDSISDIIFTPDNVSRKIKKLKISTSSGPDKISSKFLNEHVDCLSLPLSILFNRSMHSGQVPQDWKEANVTPIFKKGSKNNPSHYRPVSLTSIPCKLMESIMKDGIVEYLLRFKLINKSQHGFMSKKSCTTNLLEFLEKMTRILDDGEPADIIYLDFSKAFDKVPHKRLMKKMEALGITAREIPINEAVEQHLRRDAVERLCQVASDPFELQIAQPEDRDQLSCGCVPLGLGIFESHLGLIDFDFEQQRVAASSLARRLQARGGLLRLPRDLDESREYLSAPLRRQREEVALSHGGQQLEARPHETELGLHDLTTRRRMIELQLLLLTSK